jgi:hypothetical protein
VLWRSVAFGKVRSSTKTAVVRLFLTLALADSDPIHTMYDATRQAFGALYGVI